VLIFAYAQILGYYNLKHECILYKKIKDYLKFEKKKHIHAMQCNARRTEESVYGRREVMIQTCFKKESHTNHINT